MGLRLSALDLEINILHTFDRGGSGRVVGYLARGFADLGMRVDVLIFYRGGEVEGAVSNLIGTGIPIRYLGRLSGFRPLDLICGLPKFVRALRAERPEIVVHYGGEQYRADLARCARTNRWRLERRPGFKIKTSGNRSSVRHKIVCVVSGYGVTEHLLAGLGVDAGPERGSCLPGMAAAFPEYSALFRDVANPYVTPAVTLNSCTTHPSGRCTGAARGHRGRAPDQAEAIGAPCRRVRSRLLAAGHGFCSSWATGGTWD